MDTKGVVFTICFVLFAIAMVYILTGQGSYERNRYEDTYTEDGDNDNDDDAVYCTMDAKLCPDGSSVGRVAPRCEFAACPGTSTGTFQERTGEARLNQTVTMLNVSVTPLVIVEESRCPIGVECIQAGTVRVRAYVVGLGGSSFEQTFRLGDPVTKSGETIELIAVSPFPRANETISQNDYRFTFRVARRI